MSSRKAILLLIAGVVAIVTVFVARSLMAPPAQTTESKATIQTTEILAAARDLPTGTILKELDLKWVPWSADATLNGKYYVKDKVNMAELTGAVLREGLRSDEPILKGRIVQPHEQGFLAAVLTPGKRAMSVTLTPSAGVAGFIFPGDHVDVLLTHTFSRKDINDMNDRFVSETLLIDVRVLALDQRSDNQSNDPKVAQLATLEVTPKQAEKLALAANIVGQAGAGHAALSLALRSLALDGSSTSNTSAQNSSGTTWDSDISLAFPTVNGEDGLIQKVQVMRGRDTSETSFERHRRP